MFLCFSFASAWDVSITKLNSNTIIDNYDEEVTSLSYMINNLNCSNVSNIWFSNDSGNTLYDKGSCAPGERLVPSLIDIEGNNTWMMIVNSTDGEQKNDFVSFWVDSIAPIIEQEKEQGFLAGITGAAIGTTGGKVITGLVVLLLLIAVVYIFLKFKRPKNSFVPSKRPIESDNPVIGKKRTNPILNKLNNNLVDEKTGKVVHELV